MYCLRVSVLCLCILWAVDVLVVQSLTYQPSNLVITINGQGVLGCARADLNHPSWQYHGFNSNSNCTIIIGGNNTFMKGSCPGRDLYRYSAGARFGPTNLDLIISSTQLIDAGTYLCVDNMWQQSVSALYGVIASSLLIDSNTTLTEVPQFTPVQLTCHVQYNGSNAMPLVMTWSNALGVTFSTMTYNSSTHFYSTIVVEATQTDIFPYNCSIGFIAPTYNIIAGVTQATNVPSYRQYTLSTAYTVQPLPPAPLFVSVEALNTTALSVTWALSATATHYKVSYNDPLFEVPVISDTKYTLTGLVPGSRYTVYVSGCLGTALQYCGKTTHSTNNTYPATPDALKFHSISSELLEIAWYQEGQADDFTVLVNYELSNNTTFSSYSNNVIAFISDLPTPTSDNNYCVQVTAVTGNLTSQPSVECAPNYGVSGNSNTVAIVLGTVVPLATIVLIAVIVVGVKLHRG